MIGRIQQLAALLPVMAMTATSSDPRTIDPQYMPVPVRPEPIDHAAREALRADRLRRKRESFAKRQPKASK